MDQPFWTAVTLPLLLLSAATCSKESPEAEYPESAAESERAPKGSLEASEGRVSAERGVADEGQGEQTPPDIFDVEWRWSRFVDPVAGGLAVSNPEDYTLILTEDGQAIVYSDCNTGTGTFQLSGRELTVRILRTTLDTCGPDSLTTEFVDNLNASSNYFMQGESLYIDLRYDSGTMKFRRGPKASVGEF